MNLDLFEGKVQNVSMFAIFLCSSFTQLTDLGSQRVNFKLNMDPNEFGSIHLNYHHDPELFTTDKFTFSADYWSLGVIAYEVITGFTPFMSSMRHLRLAQWILNVRAKKSEHITIYEAENDEIIYSNRIYAENHLSNKFAELLENWLRLALEWNPKQRGRVFERTIDEENASALLSPPISVLKFFQSLDDILSTKILTMFVLTNHKYLSMEINEHTTNVELFEFIEREAQIPKSKCHLILPIDSANTNENDKNGKFDKPIDLYRDNFFDKPMIYVNQIGATSVLNDSNDTGRTMDDSITITVDMPISVKNVLINHEQRLKVHSLRKFTRDTLYFIRNENKKYKTCLDGWCCYAMQLNRDIELCRERVKQIQSMIYGMNGALEMHEQTIQIAQAKMMNFNETMAPFLEQNTKIAKNIQLLIEACDKITIRYQSIVRRSRDAYENDIFNNRNAQDFYDVTNAAKAFDAVNYQIIKQNFVDKPHFELFQCAYKCLKRRDTLLKDKAFTELQR